MKIYNDLGLAIKGGWEYVLNVGQKVEQKHWQGKPAPRPIFEAVDFCFRAPMPQKISQAEELIRPNLPWANEHFNERVSGIPFNPPPSSSYWPFHQNDNSDYKPGGVFDHTYPERFWPRNTKHYYYPKSGLYGVRFQYGDLNDLISKLKQDPLTRQGYLPIWFPEDTGKKENIRVPCTLGYHFMIRNGRLDIKYIMRSTDMLRHYQDDIYMAYRLARYISDYFVSEGIFLGYMTFITFSAHIFEGEQTILKKKI